MKNDIGEDIPDKLYKYMPWPTNGTNYAKELIKNKQIHLQLPAKFNDPFECKLFFKDKNENHENHAIYKSVSDEMNSLHRDHMLVTCLTNSPDNILMWSHYAAQHTGICMEFKMLTNNIVKVDYEKEYPIYDLDSYNIDSIEYMSKEQLIKLGKMFFARKAISWKYEQEYRYVISDKIDMVNNDYFIPLKNFADITAIICGCRMEEAEIVNIRKFLTEQGLDIPIKCAKEKEDEYGFNIIQSEFKRIE